MSHHKNLRGGPIGKFTYRPLETMLVVRDHRAPELTGDVRNPIPPLPVIVAKTLRPTVSCGMDF